MTPNDHDMFKVKNTNMHSTYIPSPPPTVMRPKFSSVSHYDELRPFLSEKCTKWPQMVLTCSRSKISTCMLHTPPETQIFVRFGLWWAIFELCPLFLEKCPEWPQMTLTCSRSKTPRCMVHTPPRPIFPSVSLYNEPFLSYGPIIGKVHWMTPNDLDMFKVKNTNIPATYTPRPKFFFFTLRWAVFEEIEIFEFPIGYNVKIKLLIT